MKKSLILLMFCVLIIFASCSKQEKMNTEIFMERFARLSPQSFSAEEKFSYNGKDIVFLKDNGGTEFVFEFTDDEYGNIKKICLAVNETDKADLMNYYCGLTVNAYAPNEDAKAVISTLFKNTLDYHSTQWYRYSSVKSDDALFFSIENMRYSTESDAQLTLKENDITFR